MKLKVRFKGIDLRGNIVKAKHTFECPDFEDENVEFDAILNGVYQTIKFVRTKEDQINNWLDEIDKMDLIYEWDWQSIVNWEIMKVKTKSGIPLITAISKEEQVLAIARSVFQDPELYLDFVAVYHNIKKSISPLKVERQFNITMDALVTSAKAATVSATIMADIISGRKTKEESNEESTMLEYKKALNYGKKKNNS